MRRGGADEWPKRFVAAIRGGKGPARAAELAGVDRSTPYKLAERDQTFRDEWDTAAKAARAARLQRAQQSERIAS